MALYLEANDFILVFSKPQETIRENPGFGEGSGISVSHYNYRLWLSGSKLQDRVDIGTFFFPFLVINKSIVLYLHSYFHTLIYKGSHFVENKLVLKLPLFSPYVYGGWKSVFSTKWNRSYIAFLYYLYYLLYVLLKRIFVIVNILNSTQLLRLGLVEMSEFWGLITSSF